ncbi:MAG: tripartite tricarboxylate transporter substrate binding protein [Desulfovibrionaceae bacterium]|jgi:tripartite-type tricarboxylate transporter receptor subunit TctC|nr:tripartite tricarboxylate transporter substrate binding protein [Desulfovibrionaceae bacterium]
MKFIRLLAGVLTLVVTVAALATETYPSRPIRMVIAFPAGGPTDVNARQFAQAMSEQLGQSVIVDNKPGAGGNLASSLVAAAPADGYTILYNTSSLLLGALLYTSAKHDPIKDFVPVVRTAGVPLVVAVNSSIPARTMSELVALAKKQPGKLNYASSGSGTIDHLAGALIAQLLKIDITHVPYKGTAPALTDLVGNQTQLMVTTLNTLVPFIRDQKLVPLAIASGQRSQVLPDVPTLSEATGIPHLELTAWNGIVAPAGTPSEIVNKLNAVVNHAIGQKEFVEKLRAIGAQAYGGTPAAYGSFLLSEQVRWKAVIEQAGVAPQ